MGRFTGKSCRLLTMLGMTATFFLVEIIVGYITNSLALVGDSYHMLSDVVALCVGFASVRISKWNTQKNTFGWARAEVLGALVNSVFLMALCFTIFVEAIQRMFHNEHIHDPDLMLIVGGIGLGVNLIGLGLFHGGHGHSHGGHGHSHGGHGHSHSKKRDHHTHSHGNGKSGKTKSSNTMLPNGEVSPSDDRLCTGLHDELSTSDEEEDGQTLQPKIKSSAQLNMRGVFLHVLGDALGSVIVIVSALIIKYVNSPWKYKADPIMSMVMVIIILCTSIPLLKESAMILMQTVPTHITVRELQEKLLQKVEGVLAVHEFHIWQLAGNRIIASAHIRCQNLRDYMRIAEDVKTFFHNEGIHSTTIQPEFLEEGEYWYNPDGTLGCSNRCLIDCCSDSCQQHKCCKINNNATSHSKKTKEYKYAAPSDPKKTKEVSYGSLNRKRLKWSKKRDATDWLSCEKDLDLDVKHIDYGLNDNGSLDFKYSEDSSVHSLPNMNIPHTNNGDVILSIPLNENHLQQNIECDNMCNEECDEMCEEEAEEEEHMSGKQSTEDLPLVMGGGAPV